MHESCDTGADLVEFKALDDVGVRHTIKGLVFDPGVGSRAKNWRSHGRQWQVKTDQGHQELTVKRPMCDYATEFRKVAI